MDAQCNRTTQSCFRIGLSAYQIGNVVIELVWRTRPCVPASFPRLTTRPHNHTDMRFGCWRPEMSMRLIDERKQLRIVVRICWALYNEFDFSWRRNVRADRIELLYVIPRLPNSAASECVCAPCGFARMVENRFTSVHQSMRESYSWRVSERPCVPRDKPRAILAHAVDRDARSSDKRQTSWRVTS